MIFIFLADCGPGFYPDPSANATCIEVPIGSYKTANGSMSFTLCADGFSTVLNGSADPTLCHGMQLLSS